MNANSTRCEPLRAADRGSEYPYRVVLFLLNSSVSATMIRRLIRQLTFVALFSGLGQAAHADLFKQLLDTVKGAGGGSASSSSVLSNGDIVQGLKQAL
ncbi:MAG: hypothetical protein K0U93_06345, partial [Gammaproteobacteria bacterium]|nr:hypothetical protein [Gammaproteobacteria bacterium]